jgi:glycosyltransferase involved in cell wall biosynthesis
VSTNIGDVSQIIQSGTTGRIVDKNEDDFTDALVDVLLKKEREKVRIECAESAAKFGFDQAGAKTVKLYKTLVASGSINSSGG